MNRYLTIGLSMLAGAALGAVAIEALHAQAKPMAYSIALNTVTDQDKYSKEFAPLIAKAIADSGGKFLARGGKTVSMHGAPPAQRVVIVQFESLEKAEAWANSAASKAAFAIGEKYATLNDFLVEGVAP
jgi:uncharacterized protein (DUF1330 family)